MNVITRLSCIIIGLVSGLFGFKWAVETHTELLAAYTLSFIIYLPIQTIILCIVSRNKNRLTKIKTNNRINISLKFSISLYLIFIILTSIFGILFKDIQVHTSFLALNCAFGLMQITTFASSSKEQIHNINRFWKIQTLAAFVRLVSIILFLKVCFWGFYGIILSNISAAMTVMFIYNISLKSIIIPLRIMKTFPNSVSKVLSLDGFIRAIRLNLEPYSILVLCSTVAYASSGQMATVILAAVNYLNALATAMRQIYSTIERDTLFGELKVKRYIYVLIQCFVLFSAAMIFTLYESIYQFVLPRIPNSFYILYAIAIYCLLFPLTIGFGFIDYFDKKRLRSFLKTTILIFACVNVIIWLGVVDALLMIKPLAIMIVPAISCLCIYIAMLRVKKSV